MKDRPLRTTVVGSLPFPGWLGASLPVTSGRLLPSPKYADRYALTEALLPINGDRPERKVAGNLAARAG